tara:strand:- start:71 stop:220 length:150 start_codon:yes stop_codon:yes gene_type:complete
MNSPIIISLDLEYDKPINNGSNFWVIGRSIIESSNPLKSLNQVLDDIEL